MRSAPHSRSRARRLPPRRATRTPEATRARILDSARALFAARGYAATTTAAIARAARVSEGLVFHWFASKEALVATVGRDFMRELVDAMFAGRGPTEEPVPPFGVMLRRTFTYVRERRALVRLLTLSPDPASSAAARQAGRAALLAPLTETFAYRAAHGLARPMDARIAAELMFALVEAALVECHVFGRGLCEADYLKETIRCVEGALCIRSARVVSNARSRPPRGRRAPLASPRR